MKSLTIQELKALINQIVNDYNVEPNEENQGDCLNAKEGFEILLSLIKENTKK